MDSDDQLVRCHMLVIKIVIYYIIYINQFWILYPTYFFTQPYIAKSMQAPYAAIVCPYLLSISIAICSSILVPYHKQKPSCSFSFHIS